MGILNKIKSHKLLKSGALYSVASTFSHLCTMVVGFINMRWLGPELLGIWQSVTLIDAYLPFLQLGIQSGLNIELPILLGERNKEKSNKLVSTALSFAVLLASLLSVVAISVLIVLAVNGCDTKVYWGVVAVSFMAITSCFNLHYIATYRSSRAFDKLSKIYIIKSILSLLMIVLIYKYQYFGLLLFYVLVNVVTTILTWYFAPYRALKPNFDKSLFIILLKRGVIMSIVNQIKAIIESLPRIILLHKGGVIQVGLFNPALSIGTFMNLVPKQIAQFLHPQMAMKYGETKRASDMWPYFKALTIFVPLVLLPFAAMGWFVMPYVLEYLFPKYIDSLLPVKIMLIGFMFSTTFFTRGFLITIKAYKESLALYLIDFVVFLSLPIGLIYVNIFPMTTSMAMGLSCAYIITYILNIYIVRNVIYNPKYN